MKNLVLRIINTIAIRSACLVPSVVLVSLSLISAQCISLSQLNTVYSIFTFTILTIAGDIQDIMLLLLGVLLS
jgi:hypothetical protein